MASPENAQALRELDSLFTSPKINGEAGPTTAEAPIHPDDKKTLGKLQAALDQRKTADRALQTPESPEASLNPEDKAAADKLDDFFKKQAGLSSTTPPVKMVE